MLIAAQQIRSFLVAIGTAVACGATGSAFSQSLPQSVPLLVPAEAMTLSAPMTAGYDITAMGGRFISVPSGTEPANPEVRASKQVTVPAGTYYLWARIAGPTTASDALYVGIDNAALVRVFAPTPGPYHWRRVPSTTDGSNLEFSLGGSHTIQVGYGEIGAKLDALYLTNSVTDEPSFSAPARLLVEAESMTREVASQMAVVNDAIALGGQYLMTSAQSTNIPPPRRASVEVHLPVGTFYLWARVGGGSITSDAMYVGINNSFARTFPEPTAPLGWAKVRVNNTSSAVAFVFPQAGVQTIQVGEGETNARIDAVYVTDDQNEVPTFKPMRRVIEAESFAPVPSSTPPITVGADANASGAQYIAAESGTSPSTRFPAASTTVDVPSGGTYFLWARLKGATATSDAMFLGINGTWDRVFPQATGVYEWVHVMTDENSGRRDFSLSAGQNLIQVAVGEIGARLDAVYITDDVNDTPAGGGSPPAPVSDCAVPNGGYEGFGGAATGGAGKTVYPVDTLADSLKPTKGMLRHALSQGDRCIRFDVHGDIKLVGELEVMGANITIDGFTAQSPGITLRAATDNTKPGLVISGNNGAHNIVVRGIRHRGSVNAPSGDGITIISGASNIVISHVSVTGARDGGIDVTRQANNVTIEWSILGRGNSASNDFLNLIGLDATRVTAHHNLYIDGVGRQPMCGGRGEVLPGSETICDFRNNLIWDFRQAGTEVRIFGKANVISSYYKNGPGAILSQTIRVDGGGIAYTAGNRRVNDTSINDSGNRDTEFPVENAPLTTDARTAAIAIRGTATGRDGAGARGANFELDDTDQGFINRIAIP